MNLGSLWSGNDYALFESKGRNEHYRDRAQRVRIIRTLQESDYGSKRARGMAEVTFLHDNGDPVKMYDGKDRVVKVRARDIAMRWEEYDDERIHRSERLAKAQEEQRLAREVDTAKRVRIIDTLEKQYGIPRDWITVSEYSITMSRAMVERELLSGTDTART